MNELLEELKAQHAWPLVNGYNRAIVYENSDPTIARAQRITPSTTITDTSEFEFLPNDAEVVFDELYTTSPAG